ncbi:unnamed protein product [Trifolium pratense]|uniref:Uncharacterized protein n=1 Tax=Trifolium pratense TaxID=57577 RepID=A0ACB0L973_TRIPR|nr:unnamed protein product [Trifolium pratense]
MYSRLASIKDFIDDDMPQSQHFLFWPLAIYEVAALVKLGRVAFCDVFLRSGLEIDIDNGQAIIFQLTIKSWKLDPNLSELTLGLGFDLDVIPSAFPSRLDQHPESSINYDLVDDAIQRLAQLISAVGQSRFRRKRKPRTLPSAYYYNCPQDTGYYGQKETPLIRDAHRMERELYLTIVLTEHIALDIVYVLLGLEILVLQARQGQDWDLRKTLYSLCLPPISMLIDYFPDGWVSEKMQPKSGVDVLLRHFNVLTASQEDSVVADISSSDEDETLFSEDDLGFEDNISATFKPQKTNAVVQVDEAIKLFDDFADLVRHQRSIGATIFFERLRETRAHREIEGVMADLTWRER